MRFLAFRKYAYWVLLALMACLAVACIDWRGGHHNEEGNNVKEPESILDRVTEEDLNSFNPDIPLTKGSGQSDAFTMHPFDEMTISAPAGAFDQNPDIHVSVASGQQLQAAEDKLAELMPDHELLWGYDIDAGLPSDSVLPGKYTVKINLNKLDIPEELHQAIRMVRMDDKGNLLPLNSRVKDGVICYEACQNSMIVIVGTPVLIGLTAWGLYDGSIGLPVRLKMISHDLMQVPVTDPFGNFNVLFRFSQTENGDRIKEYIAKNDELEKRLADLEEQAQKDYDKAHPTQSLCQWLENAEKKRERQVGRENLYYQLVSADPEVKRLVKDPDIELPRSVLDVIKATRLANRFSRDPAGLGMKPLSYSYNVYLVPQGDMGKGEETTLAKFQPQMYWRNHWEYPIPIPKAVDQWGYILVNIDSYLKKSGSKYTYAPINLDATCVTMAHEISHAFECEYVHCVWVTNTQFFEAIGSMTEHWFAAWMKKKGYLNIEDTESKEAAERLNYSNKKLSGQFYAWPLELDYPKNLIGKDKPLLGEDIPSNIGGYALGDLVQYLCDHKKKVSFDHIMKNYSYDKNFLQDLMDIFGFERKSEFTPYYEQVCMNRMPEIVETQTSMCAMEENKNLLLQPIEHSPSQCVQRLENLGHNGTTKAYPFAVKVMKILCTGNPDKTPYSLFAVPSTKIFDHELMFTFLEGDSLQQAEDSLFTEPCKKKYVDSAKAAIFYREFAHLATFDNNYYIDVVALYQPKEPKVLGLTEDDMGLRVYTGDKPDASLLQDPENPYVSGMQMVVINNKTKQKQLLNVPLRKCGQEVEIPLASIGITKSDDIDICMRTRWYYRYGYGKFCYSPATERVNYKQQREQEQQRQTTEPESSTGNGQQFTEVEISYIKFKTGLYANCTHTHYDKNGKIDKTEEYVVGSSFEGGWFDQSFTAEYFTSSFSGSTLHVKGEYEYRGQKYDISFDVTGIAGDCKEARVSSLTCKRVNFESVFGHEKYNFTATYSNIPVKVGKRSTSNPLTLRSLTFEGTLANGMGISGYSCEKYTNDGWGGYNHYHFDYLDDAANFATLEINFKSVK